MSARKIGNKSATDTQTTGTILDTSSPRSTATKASAQIGGSETTTIATDALDSTMTDSKRPRRTNVRTPTTPTTTNRKKIDESSENISPPSSGGLEEEKGTKPSVDDMKIDDSKKTDSLPDIASPARPGRKRKIFDKTAIVTRKSAMDMAKSTKRVLRCDRRNSTGKADIVETEPVKKRGGSVKKLSSTPEPPVTAIKRKRENSLKLDEKDDFRKPEKIIKLEPTDIDEVQNHESDLKTLNTCKKGEEKENESVEETYSKDDELVEVVAIKQEADEETEEGHIVKLVTGNGKPEGSTSKEIPIEMEPGQDEVTLPKVQEGEKCVETKARNDQTTSGKKLDIAKPEVTNDKPRRARTKRVLDIFTTPATRGAKKSEKTGNEVNSTGKGKPGRKPKQAIAATLEVKEDEVFANPDSEKCKMISAAPCEEECNLSGVATPLFLHIASKKSSIDKEISTNISPQSSNMTVSISPELVSEGVNVISVKQYYKKPEFLENNLGIENDPKLGGIVQEVDKDKASCIEETFISGPQVETENSTEKLPHRSPSCSGDSLKDCERLFLDDSTEDDVNKVENDQDVASTSQEVVEQIALEEGHSVQAEAEDEDVNEEETLSNSSTVKNTNELEICDSSNILTAVDSGNTEEQSVGKSDIYLKDKQMEDDETASADKQTEKMGDTKYESCENTFPEERDEYSKKNRKMSLEQLLRNAVLDGTDQKDNFKTDCLTERQNDDAMIKNRNVDSIAKNEDMNNYEDIVKQDELKADNLLKEETDDGNEMESHEETIKNLAETPETFKEKENHLKHLGLLTHKAAVEAKIEKQRRRKLLQTEFASNGKKNGKQYDSDETSETSNHTVDSESSRSNAPEAAAGISNRNVQEYTGTLKTVIKINRQSNGPGSCDSKRKTTNCTGGSSSSSGRQSLKMTFQKGRGRNTNNDNDNSQPAGTTDDTYYTIQNEIEGTQQQETVTHGRKSHNRSHTTESTSAAVQENESKKDDKVIIVIPEKASSFSIHPGRLCQDQCYYCGGKFGLYDTPCHVAQLKSVERQQKILANEEKLTSDNCLCDACFRHIDRRANANISTNTSKKRSIISTVSDSIHSVSGMNSDASGADEMPSSPPIALKDAKPKGICFLPNCENEAIRPLRRKFIRKTIKKLLPNFDMSTIGSMAQICTQHHDIVLQFLGCALCKRRLVKNSMYHINQDSEKLEQLLGNQGIPVKLGNNTAVCKLCKYFTNLLLKPPDSGKIQKTQFVKNYRKRLLYCHNVTSDGTSDGEEQVDDKSENEDTGKQEKINTVGRRGRKKKSLLAQSTATSEQSSEQVNKSGPKSPEDGMLSTSMATSGQMMLDNDVMVDYDVPVPISDSPSPPPVHVPSKLQTILQSGISNKDDISIVLRSNPNISMRELFPGEEEMGLQINVPFGSSSSVRTPEGWTRVNSFLQYDDSTRRLWEDLQKPYGNQSSFLRHLILLEKYFRNGDLVLSPSATTNAVVYSETVHNRLRSYDSTNTTPSAERGNRRKGNSQNETSIEQFSKQFVNLPVTITSKPKSSRRSSCNLERLNSSSGNSSLKSNILSNSRAVEILPIMPTNYDCSIDRSNSSGNMSRQQRLLEAATKLINSTQDSSINQTTGGGNKKSVVSGVGVGLPPELISINRNQNNGMQYTKGRSNQAHMKQGSYKSGPPNVIILPDTLSPIERAQKNWRPTLVPVSSVNSQTFLSASGPLFQTADGRRLPALVQVQSGGRPYLISIHDYNRMCIMRREKLLRDQMAKGTKKDEENTSTKNETLQQQLQSKMQIPNKILEQNSLIPVGSNYRSQQSMADQKNKKFSQQTLLKSATVTTPTALIPIAPRPPGQMQMVPPTIASQQHALVFGQNATALPNSVLPPISGVLTIAPPNKASSSTAWLWSNVADNATSVNGTTSKTTSAPSSSSSNSSSPSSLTHQQQSQGNQSTIILDNSLMSKIPKSLTVIPQQKSQGFTRTNSADDETSA